MSCVFSFTKLVNLHEKLSKPLCPTLFRLFSSIRDKKSHYDIVVVGGGIVGMATAQELILRHRDLSIAVVEKEPILAAHQSGNNSGIVHAGIYYSPGSLKAQLCVKGLRMAFEYFDEHDIPYVKCGKLIVAVDKTEIPRLQRLYENGLQNGVPDLKIVGPAGIKEIEPNCSGLMAIHSPHTSIVDWAVVTSHYGRRFKKLGGTIYTDFPVCDVRCNAGSPELAEGAGGAEHAPDSVRYPVMVVGDEAKNQKVFCRYLVTCAGLHADKLAAMSGCSSEPQIIPFRGEFLLLNPARRGLIKGNIYPVPTPGFPFLGVHFTPRMNGSVLIGPNAVFAFKREGYRYCDISISELLNAASYRGLRKLAWRHLGYGLHEMYKSINIQAQVRHLQRLVPDLRRDDVTRGPSGVRAQAVDRDGNLVDDFVFDQGQGQPGERTIHVRNCPSPAATSSLAIAKMIVDKVDATFRL